MTCFQRLVAARGTWEKGLGIVEVHSSSSTVDPGYDIDTFDSTVWMLQTVNLHTMKYDRRGKNAKFRCLFAAFVVGDPHKRGVYCTGFFFF